MKKKGYFSISFVATTFGLLFLCFPACAQNKITASLTITNLTTNGMTFTLNGDTRTFTNNVSNPATMVLTNSDATGSGTKTNLLLQIQVMPFSQVRSVNTGSNSFDLVGNADLPMALSFTAGYASASYSTQLVTDTVILQGPVSALPTAQARTNVASDIVGAAAAAENTNSIPQASKAASELVGTNGTQTIPGQKTFSNGASVWSGIVSSPNISGYANVISNGTYYGASIVGGSISGLPSINLSNNAGSETSSFFTHYDNLGGDSFMVGHGGSEFVLGIFNTNSTSTVGSESKSFIDFNINGESEYNIAGSGLLAHRFYIQPNGATATNYLEITTSGVRAPIFTAPFIGNGGGLSNINSAGLTNSIPPGPLSGAVITNLTHIGTNNFPAGSDIAFGRYANSALANGNNAGVVVGTNVYVAVSGPTGAFTINGIAGGRDGKIVVLENSTTQTITIANESGTDPTPANRIKTGLSGDYSNTNSPGMITLIYSGSASRWIIQSHN